MRFIAGGSQPEMRPEDLCVAVRAGKLLLHEDGRFPTVADVANLADPWCIGTFDNTPVWTGAAGSLPPNTIPATPSAGATRVGARSSDGGRGRGLVALEWLAVAGLSEVAGAVGARALSVVNWRRAHRYCGGCRAELVEKPQQGTRDCPSCGLRYSMTFQPVVLVCVTRGDEVLLVRHTYGNTEVWALVGGLVEVGETLEDAARREVAEEVGLQLTHVTYAGSQPWHAGTHGKVLAAFTATCDEGEPVIDPDELADARWFPFSALPAVIPAVNSLSRRLLDQLSAGVRE